MSATSDLLAYYRLRPLIAIEENKRLGDLDSSQQLNAFKTWSITSNTPLPNRADTSLPVAVESKRFPGQYLSVRWTGSAREAEARRAEPDQKNLADFATLLSAERTVDPARVHQVYNILRGIHYSTGLSANSKVTPSPDGEHATWGRGRLETQRNFHGYIIYPKGVPLGSSSADREARWRNQDLTTAEVAFTRDTVEDPALTEPLGREIYNWFRTTYADPMLAGDLCIRFIMVYDRLTRSVQLYREDADPASGPEHTFTTPCRWPWEKLGLAPPYSRYLP